MPSAVRQSTVCVNDEWSFPARMSIPHSVSEITPDWLNSVLASSEILNDHQVVACDVQIIGSEFGFASRVASLCLSYDSADCNVPSTMIVKLAANHDDRERAEKLREKCLREAAFYTHIGPDAGIATPRCYYVACAPNGTRFAALLEDLGHGRFGDVARGCSPDEAGLVVESLAALHARWWNDPRLANFDWLPTFGNVSSQLQKLEVRRERFLKQFGELLPRQVAEMTLRLGPEHVQLLQRVQGPPVTLLHVDCHLDNVVFLGTGGDVEPVLFDWQGVSKGLCTVDLALFLTSASPEPHRFNENELLKRYHDTLSVHGVCDYPLDRLTRDYRIALLRWWIGTVNGLSSTHAQTWTGRQADLTRKELASWSAAVINHRLPQLL